MCALQHTADVHRMADGERGEFGDRGPRVASERSRRDLPLGCHADRRALLAFAVGTPRMCEKESPSHADNKNSPRLETAFF